MSFLPIDPNFQKNREKVGEEKGIAIWGPMDPPETLGIRGTYVAVDWDLCTGCGICLKLCPMQLFEWVETSGHPTSEKKAFPARELDCVLCEKCIMKCSVQAIKTIYQPNFWTDWVVFPLLFVQIIGGIIYGIMFGPSLGLQALFYVGWGVFVVGVVFVLSSLSFLSKRGKAPEEKNLMYSTVLVDSGTYGIVRHPQYLGMILMLCAAFLVSQHWLFAILGIFLISTFPKFARDEEEHLIAKFGDEYKSYMQKVPRLNFIVGIIRLLQHKKKE